MQIVVSRWHIKLGLMDMDHISMRQKKMYKCKRRRHVLCLTADSHLEAPVLALLPCRAVPLHTFSLGAQQRAANDWPTTAYLLARLSHTARAQASLTGHAAAEG